MRVYHLNAGSSGSHPVPVERPVPTPGPGEVRIRVVAVSLNFRDLLVAESAHAGQIPHGRIPLSDAAGIVDAVGGGVASRQLGERVMVSFFPAWLDGAFRSHYMSSALGGARSDGVLAEYIVVPAAAVVPIAAGMSFIEASTLPCAAVTAWHGLVVRAGLGSQDTVVIPGTGGVALFALQMTKKYGARGILLSSSDAKLERARALGADECINYRKTPAWEHEVLALTGGEGASIVLELGGADTYQRSLDCLAPAGRIVQVGVLTGFGAHPKLDRLQSLNADILGVTVGSTRHLLQVSQFYAQHGLHPVVDSVFGFDEVPQAYSHLRDKTHMGKVVVQIADPSGADLG